MTGVIRAPEVHFAGVKFRSSKPTCTSFLSSSRPANNDFYNGSPRIRMGGDVTAHEDATKHSAATVSSPPEGKHTCAPL
jgi:hypothetical protein